MRRGKFDIMSLVSNDYLIVIACSTGGPRALNKIIPKLPGDLEVPVVVVQHMAKGFTAPLANRLNSLSKINVSEVVAGVKPLPGNVYVAPSGWQTVYKKGRLELTTQTHISSLAPCADIFIESLVESDYKKIICCVLTGMGHDATEGIRILKEKKDVYVIAQDKKSSLVYGMPHSVTEEGLTNEEAALDTIAARIINYVEVLKDGC